MDRVSLFFTENDDRLFSIFLLVSPSRDLVLFISLLFVYFILDLLFIFLNGHLSGVFSDLKTGKCSSVVEARILRYWEARNVKRGGELMWMDMLLVDIAEPVSALPEEGFRFRDQSELLGLANTNTQLPEILGVKSTVTDPPEEKNRVMVTMKMDSDDTATLSLFNSQAVAFHKQLEAMHVDPKVIVATTINPKMVGG
ncbi:hypothetical protein IGI04_037505 [Brassica rapa subsp. trilocularis]|uniref:Replication factor A C-terminal domain-containing protein n=1 Tax=Brassica rapa subsp. trilocularis TaxID=1813537 RepID=A0ABQ7LK83_BRACM|nr:hypothetical protein IGI04_037505 [Brassica rapa subsp. trilocularis]